MRAPNRLSFVLLFALAFCLTSSALAARISSFAVDSSIIGASNQRLHGSVSVTRDQNDTGPITVFISTSGPIIGAPGFVVVEPGESSADFTGGESQQVDFDTDVTLTAEVGTPGETPLTRHVTDIALEVSITIAPSAIHASEHATVTVSISATSDGAVVDVTADHGMRATPNGFPSLFIPIGENAVSYPSASIAVSQPTTFTFTALAANISTATLTIYPDGVPIPPPPNNPLRCKECELNASSPVNIANGNVWIDEADYSIPGLGGGLSLGRTWNSQWRGSSPVELVGMFGDSWRSTFEERLQTNADGSVQYWMSNGNFFTYSFDSLNHVYHLISPLDEHATLTVDSQTGNRSINFPEGNSKLFNSAGYLIAMVDRNGNTSIVAYDSGNRITSVTDAAGRVLTFNYPDGSTHLVSTVTDATGTIATYAYGAN